MRTKAFDNQVENQWCPGCSNFGILTALKSALSELGKAPEEVCIVSGIGQAAKLPHYLNCHFFNGLHGRALPVAVGIHAGNPKLTTLVVTGEGDCYGEGGNHFLHTLRRNPDICIIVHNNERYALTKGQASPTTPVGARRSLPSGPVESSPLNMLGVAIVHEAGFVARGFAGEIDHLKDLIKGGISVKGLAIIEVLQPCITWGTRPAGWYKERVYKIDEAYDPADQHAALDKVSEPSEKIAIGVLYRGKPRTLFAQRFRKEITERPLFESASINTSMMTAMLEAFK